MSESDPHAWTDEERERARQVLERDARSLNSKTHDEPRDPVSPGECREWRRKVKQRDVRPSDIETDYVKHTVECHVRGECSHDPDKVGVAARYSTRADQWISDYGDG